MSSDNITSVVAVLPVKDHAKAVAWYATLLGREADVVPDESVAEWQLAENAWVQVGADPEQAGGTTVVIGVRDLEAQRGFCVEAGVKLGETVEYPQIIKMAETRDPAGNRIVFVEDLSAGA